MSKSDRYVTYGDTKVDDQSGVMRQEDVEEADDDLEGHEVVRHKCHYPGECEIG
jgi:hypothetical protein